MAVWKQAGRRGATALAIVGAALATTAAGDGVAHATRAPGAPAGALAAPADTTITIRTTGSSLEFSPARIALKQGTRVRIRYVNEGTLPHNFVLVRDADDIDMLGMAAFEAKKTDYVPLEHEDRLIAHTRLAVPGETVEFTFEVPPAGEYLFVCLYAGHYNMMIGTLRSLN